MSQKQILWTGLTMLSLLLVVGCESSRIATRRQAYAADYAALTAEEKALVDRGELGQGMSTNAVIIAWGQPNIISTTPTPNGPFVIWEYYQKRTIANPALQRNAMGSASSQRQAMVAGATPYPESWALSEEASGVPRSTIETLARTAVFHKERLVNWSREQP